MMALDRFFRSDAFNGSSRPAANALTASLPLGIRQVGGHIHQPKIAETPKQTATMDSKLRGNRFRHRHLEHC